MRSVGYGVMCDGKPFGVWPLRDYSVAAEVAKRKRTEDAAIGKKYTVHEVMIGESISSHAPIDHKVKGLA